MSHWQCFRDFVLREHPDWEPYFLGELAGHGIYGGRVSRFFFEIPSEHPVITDPLTVEIADREPGGPIDIYWGRAFEHICLCRRTIDEQLGHVIHRVEQWLDESLVRSDLVDTLNDERRSSLILKFPLDQSLLDEAKAKGQRVKIWSWKGTHDRIWS